MNYEAYARNLAIKEDMTVCPATRRQCVGYDNCRQHKILECDVKTYVRENKYMVKLW